jgi:crossover junction endodeoxyribonuclease RuvC
MFVLGIDPGLTRCGYGLLRRAATNMPVFEARTAGVIETAKELAVEQRLGLLSVEVEGLLDEFEPSVVVVEKIFFQTHVRTAVSVAQASGVILAAAARRGLEVAHLTPNEVKLGVVGNGAATKSQVQEMVARLCGLAEPPSPPDVADAMALAACYLSSARLRSAIAGNPS